MEKCSICCAPNEFFGTQTILNDHEVSYYRCRTCGFIQTEKPYWLPQAYEEAINQSDIGLVARNLRLARLVKALICLFYNGGASYLDYGGGYGLLVRLMRDEGFYFYRYDKYCQNLFATGSDLEDHDGENFELVTAFELFEHVHDPVEETATLLTYAPDIFLTTEFMREPPPKLGSWWYYGPEHGQHVSFYTLKSMQCLAERFSLNLYSARGSYHLLSKRKISPFLYRSLFRKKITALIDALYKNSSLREDDYRRITGMSRNNTPLSGTEKS